LLFVGRQTKAQGSVEPFPIQSHDRAIPAVVILLEAVRQVLPAFDAPFSNTFPQPADDRAQFTRVVVVKDY
jgi:hypothetical protein